MQWPLVEAVDIANCIAHVGFIKNVVFGSKRRLVIIIDYHCLY
jgi:hypothetical protein